MSLQLKVQIFLASLAVDMAYLFMCVLQTSDYISLL